MLVLVYDVTNKSLFANCTKWLERARAQKPEQLLPGVLLGNKSDLTNWREVSEREGQQLASQNELAFLECSTVSCYCVFFSTVYCIPPNFCRKKCVIS